MKKLSRILLRRRPAQSGQILAGVIVILLIASIMVPLMVLYTQREAVWTAKQARSTAAFHLAEAGLEKGYLAISQSTAVWVALQNGTPPTDFDGTRTFSDVSGGRYTVTVTSGPLDEQVTIIAKGIDTTNREVRALKAVYSNATLGEIAIFGGGGVQIGGGVNVEWGSIISPGNVDSASRLSPQFWAAGEVTGYDTDPNPPNCDAPDCCQWHSFSNQIPDQPLIDLNFYRSSAQATGTYYSTAQTWKGLTDTSGKTHFVENNLTLASPGIHIIGTLIVTGNMDSGNGVWGNGTLTMTVPEDAWKQYCRNWAWFRSEFLANTGPTSFPGLNSSYQVPGGTTYTSKKISVSGLLYVGGAFVTGGGGGQADVHGAFLVVGTSSMTNNSGVTVYYNTDAGSGMQTTKIQLTRQSWQDILSPWTGAP